MVVLASGAVHMAVAVSLGVGMAMGVIMTVRRRVHMAVMVVMGMAMVLFMRMCMCMSVSVARLVRTTFRLKRIVGRHHRQVHAAQHLGQHWVRLYLEVIWLEFDGDVAVAQVVGGTCEVEGASVFAAGANQHDGLGRSDDPHEAAVISDQDITAAHHGTPLQEDAEGSAVAVDGLKAAFLANVPVQFDLRRPFQQHGGQALAARNDFGDGQHGVVFNGSVKGGPSSGLQGQ